MIGSHMNPYAVDLQNISVVRRGRFLLRDVFLTVSPGACCAILGPNGSGKSTLMSVLSGYTWPSSGFVAIGDQVFGRTDLACVRKGIGLIEPSRSPAFDEPMQVREVVATGFFGTIRLPLDRDVEPSQWRRVDAELDQLGLAQAGENVFSHLSTGEQMKVLLARAMVADAGLLMLDEPTAGLDMGARAACVGVLERLLNRPNHPTVVIVSHHLDELPEQVDQVVLLKGGAVFAAGPADEVLSSDRLSGLFECRIEVFKSRGRYIAGVHGNGG
jgi:iron complex transport system ATP-binding protein